MSAVLVRNDPAAGQAPHKPDGAWYRFEMLCHSDQTRAYADTADELLAVLMGPAYADLRNDDARLQARISWATSLLAPMQAAVYTSVDSTVRDDLPDADRATLLQPRHVPVVVDEWSSPVPLVLVDVHYAPYTDIPAPMSTVADVADPPNIVWLRPTDPVEFLLSLDRTGYITLNEQDDFAI